MFRFYSSDVILVVFIITGITQLHRRRRFDGLAARFDFPSDVINIPPESWPFSIRKVGLIHEVVLRYNLSNVSIYKWTLLESDVLEFGRSDVSLSQHDLEKIDDNRWFRPIRRRVFLAYPQSIDLRETIDRIIHQQPISEVSKSWYNLLLWITILIHNIVI